MRKKACKLFFWGLFSVLLLVWFFVIVEAIVLYACHDFCTAGQLFAFLIPNNYEANDISFYILRFELPCLIGVSLPFVCGILLLWKISKQLTVPKAIISSMVVFAFFLPFVIPGQPLCLVREMAVVFSQINYIKQHKRDADTFEYKAYQPKGHPRREIYILSIGESLRSANMSLVGTYSRKTTPLLETENQLCYCANYYAGATLTQYALPLLFTDYDSDGYRLHFNHRTIAKAFKECGFYTALVSNQSQLMNNGLHGYLIQDFDSIVWVQHDSLIAPTLVQLSQRHDRLFLVSHYLGNHFLYGNCPPDYKKWLPDYNLTPMEKSDSLYVNAYDNSLLYQDALLSNAIAGMKSMKRAATWLFVSDHGERIMPQFGVHGHTYHPTKEEYHVPLMVWYSDEYKTAYPQKVANLIKHKDAPVCADHVFWSVLDMAGIRIDSTLQQDGMSIFGDTLLPHQRTLLLPDGKSIMTLD